MVNLGIIFNIPIHPYKFDSSLEVSCVGGSKEGSQYLVSMRKKKTHPVIIHVTPYL